MKKRMNVFLSLTVLALSLAVLGCGGGGGPSVLGAPKNVTVTVVSATELKVSWDAVTDAESYNVYRSLLQNDEDPDRLDEAYGISARTYTDDGVGPETTYYYYVAAVDAGGTEGARGKGSEKTTALAKVDVSLPTVPGNAFTTGAYKPEPNFNSVEIIWPVVEDPAPAGTSYTGYNVYRKEGTGAYTFVGSAPSELAGFTDDSVSGEKTYTYKVTVVVKTTTDGVVKESNEVFTIPVTTPKSPDKDLGANATVAEIIKVGTTFLVARDYDNASKYYEQAYSKDKTNTEAIVYSSLAKLASIATDTKVQNLFKNRLGIQGYPAKLGKLISGKWMVPYIDERIVDYRWPDTEWDYEHRATWIEKGEKGRNGIVPVSKTGYYEQQYSSVFHPGPTERLDGEESQGYEEYVNNYEGWRQYVWYSAGDEASSWYDSSTYTIPTDGYYYQTPMVTYTFVDNAPKEPITYSWISQYPALSIPQWVKDNGSYDDSLTSLGQRTTATWNLLLFTNLLDKNNNGLNTALDEVISSVFGSAFNDVVTRVKSLDYSKTVSLDKEIIKRFDLEDLLEDGTSVGKLELDLLVSSLQLIKGTLEWVSSYDWNTNLNFLKINWTADGDKELKDQLKLISPNDLPLRNNFLKARSNADSLLTASKNDYLAAIASIIASYDYFVGDGSKTLIPQGAKDEVKRNAWIKDALTAVRTALNTGGKVGIPRDIPTSTWAAAHKDYDVDFGKVFTKGYLSIDKLVETETGGKSPQFYGFGKDSVEGGDKITSQTSIKKYDVIGIKINLNPINEIAGAEDLGKSKVIDFIPTDIAEILYERYHK